MTLVITACTNRKRRAVSGRLAIGSLGKTSLVELAAVWGTRLRESHTRYPAKEVYGGRGFQEAVAAASAVGGRLAIVSAGLGLVDGSSDIPPYACTIVTGSADSVSSLVDGEFSAASWWSEVGRASPHALNFEDAAANDEGLILVSLSEAYLEMFAGDLVSLPNVDKSRLRLFTRAPRTAISSKLRPFVMPYDDRLDGPDSAIPGTLSDFASRALKHFCTHVLDRGAEHSVADHIVAVDQHLSAWRRPEKIARLRMGDDQILEIMRCHWADPTGMSLGRLRGEFNVACEQSRYSGLARIIRGEAR